MKSLRKKGRFISLLLCAALLFSNALVLSVSAESITPDAECDESAEHLHVHNADCEQIYESVEDAPQYLQADSVDLTRPVITVTPADEYVYENLYYCEVPTVTITDEGENLASVTIKTYDNEKTEDISGGSYELDLSGILGSVKITVKDTANNTEFKQIIIGHMLGGRQGSHYDANCIQPGRETTVYTCKTCKKPYYQYDKNDVDNPAKGHSFDDSEKTVDMSKCGGQGNMTLKTCKECGFIQISYSEDYVEGEQHNWESKKHDPTCTESGSTWDECSTCGAVRNVNTVKATAHHLGEWKTVKPADCQNGIPGTQERSCDYNCGTKVTMSIPAVHVWSSRVTVVEPSCDSVGYSGFKCLNCGMENQPEKYRWTIPALGHDYSGNHDCTIQSQCKRCGHTIPAKENHVLSDYKSDGEAHWRECTSVGCTFTTERETHSRPEDSSYDCTNTSICTICNAKSDSEYEAHEWKYESDDNFHWQVCTHPNCTVKTQKVPHNVKDDHNCETELKCLDCQKVLAEATKHAFSEKYTYTVGQHWQVCTNEGCNQTTTKGYHNFDDDHNCTTLVSCVICGYVGMSGEQRHNYTDSPIYGDEQGHYKQCQNDNCNITERAGNHSGGEATCVTQAVCDECHLHYGELNLQNHVETELINEKPATQTEHGYTGDLICKGCKTVITPGEDIPPIPEECSHQWKDMVDDARCWKQCEICGERKDVKDHEFEMKNGPQGHWQQCKNCKHTNAVIPHDIDENDIDNDCTTEIDCKVCGYVMTEAYPNHVWGDDLLFSDTEHWRVCTNPGCEQKGEINKHNPVDDGDCKTAVYCQDCKHILVAAEDEHNWSSVWKSDAQGHYKECQNIDCKQVFREEHQKVEDDGNCTTPIICRICSYEIEPGAAEHNFGGDYITSETGHRQKCQNAGCNVESSETIHSGGEATCKNAAVCVVCAKSYGSKNPDNHTGNSEVRGYIAPTTENEGFTGNLVCVDCEAILKPGVILDKLQPEHQHVFDEKLFDDTHHWDQCSCGNKENYEEHSFGDYESDNTHHWHSCTKCGKVVSLNHEFVDGKCTVCGFKMIQHEHSFEWQHDEHFHWQACTDCEETKNNGEHSGGKATCKDKAVCDECNAEYGEKDPQNHVGGTKIVGQIEPTTEKEGYTGDEVCNSCGEIIKKGESIPRLRLLGDVNNDGVITISDAIEAQKHIAALITLSGEDFTAADVDKNGYININDVIMIQKHIAGIIKIN